MRIRNNRIVVLNSAYQPVSTTRLVRAVELVRRGDAEIHTAFALHQVR